jgi:hypothetical protein
MFKNREQKIVVVAVAVVAVLVVKVKVKISLLQAVEAHRVAGGQGSHIT